MAEVVQQWQKVVILDLLYLKYEGGVKFIPVEKKYQATLGLKNGFPF